MSYMLESNIIGQKKQLKEAMNKEQEFKKQHYELLDQCGIAREKYQSCLKTFEQCQKEFVNLKKLDKEAAPKNQKKYFRKMKRLVASISMSGFMLALIISNMVLPIEVCFTLQHLLTLASITTLIAVPSYFKVTKNKRYFFENHKLDKKNKKIELEKAAKELEQASLERINLNIQRNTKRDNHVMASEEVSDIRDKINRLEEFKEIIEQNNAKEVYVEGRQFALIQGGKRNA